MAYHTTEPKIGLQPLGSTSSTLKHPLGTRVKAVDSTLGEGEFVYAQASSSITQYDAIYIKGTGKAAQLTIDTAKIAQTVGFSQVAVGTKDEYFWAQLIGKPLVRLAADCDKDLALYATATGGVLDDATVSAMIQGVVCTTSVTGATTAATCVANFPTVHRRDASAT